MDADHSPENAAPVEDVPQEDIVSTTAGPSHTPSEAPSSSSTMAPFTQPQQPVTQLNRPSPFSKPKRLQRSSGLRKSTSFADLADEADGEEEEAVPVPQMPSMYATKARKIERPVDASQEPAETATASTSALPPSTWTPKKDPSRSRLQKASKLRKTSSIADIVVRRGSTIAEEQFIPPLPSFSHELIAPFADVDFQPQFPKPMVVDEDDEVQLSPTTNKILNATFLGDGDHDLSSEEEEIMDNAAVQQQQKQQQQQAPAPALAPIAIAPTQSSPPMKMSNLRKATSMANFDRGLPKEEAPRPALPKRESSDTLTLHRMASKGRLGKLQQSFSLRKSTSIANLGSEGAREGVIASLPPSETFQLPLVQSTAGGRSTNLRKATSFADIFKERAMHDDVNTAPGGIFQYSAFEEPLNSTLFSSLPVAAPAPPQPVQRVLKAKQHALSIMAKHTFEEGRKQQLICDLYDQDTGDLLLQGVALRVSKNNFAVYPREDRTLTPWITALCVLNVESAITLATTVTEGIIDMIPPDSKEVAISPDSHIQVLKEAADVAHARKAQGAAFVLEDKCVVIWSDEADKVLIEAQKIHEKLTQFLWAVAATSSTMLTTQEVFVENGAMNPSLSPASSSFANSTTASTDMSEPPSSTLESNMPLFNSPDSGDTALDKEGPMEKEMMNSLEDGVQMMEFRERPTMVLSAITHGCACSLAIFISVLQLRNALVWSLFDENWYRLAIAIICPIYFVVIMFFCDNIVQYLFMLAGPVRQLQHNSRYFSGKKPDYVDGGPLPHITVQMPVYKEDFDFVLKPSFESIKKAIRTYELQGGSASIIISEDGMVLVDPIERAKRLEYYEDNNITWIGRPKHGKDGFIREGRFKKASNLNFTYDVMLKTDRLVEERLAYYPENVSRQQIYNECLRTVLAEIHPDACGVGGDQIGEFLLLIDSDTRVPEDCFLDAATEMTTCPDVGILQHCSGVMIVSTSYFEKCIAYFTRLVNFAISYAVANGDMAPFMGHNAYLRWSAMREIGKMVTLPNGQQQLKIWSESHVSEDFVMALDMIERGYTVRWATYANSEYMEGVSLSCDDELNRWQKYAWGVSEMIFNPLTQWWRGGPFTPLFRRFIFGCAPVHYKWASCSYCFSYYAIGLAFPLTFALVLIQGWLGGDGEAPYIPSFEVLVACLVVFSAGGTLALTVVRFRAGYGTLIGLAFENIAHLPFLVVFFGGLSYHVSTALLSHIIGIDMTWGATLKDIEMTNFFVEAPLILKRHYRLFLICVVIIGGVSVLDTTLVPLLWRVEGFFVLFPVYFLYSLHCLFPIVLNPSLIRFSF